MPGSVVGEDCAASEPAGESHQAEAVPATSSSSCRQNGHSSRRDVHSGLRPKVFWSEDFVFKIEQDECGLDDDAMDGWVEQMDQHLKDKFGDTKPNLTASQINLSHNRLGNQGICAVVSFLRRRKITVQKLKFHKNSIGDKGAKAIGKWLKDAPKPVQEIHLSHNNVSSDGAVSLLEGLARSGRYPCPSGDDKSGSSQLMPLWLRMECNNIEWSKVWEKLKDKEAEVTWIIAKTRESCIGEAARDTMVCMHKSWWKQGGWEEGDDDFQSMAHCRPRKDRHMQSGDDDFQSMAHCRPRKDGVHRNLPVNSTSSVEEWGRPSPLSLFQQILPESARIRVIPDGDTADSGAEAHHPHGYAHESHRSQGNGWRERGAEACWAESPEKPEAFYSNSNWYSRQEAVEDPMAEIGVYQYLHRGAADGWSLPSRKQEEAHASRVPLSLDHALPKRQAHHISLSTALQQPMGHWSVVEAGSRLTAQQMGGSGAAWLGDSASAGVRGDNGGQPEQDVPQSTSSAAWLGDSFKAPAVACCCPEQVPLGTSSDAVASAVGPCAADSADSVLAASGNVATLPEVASDAPPALAADEIVDNKTLPAADLLCYRPSSDPETEHPSGEAASPQAVEAPLAVKKKSNKMVLTFD